MIDLLLSLAAATLVRTTALAAAVALVLAVFRIRASSTRHTAWVAVLAVMLLMPILTRVVPPIRVPVSEWAVPFRIEPFVNPPVRNVDTPPAALPASMTPDGALSAPVIAPGQKPSAPPATPAVPLRWDVLLLAVYLAGLSFLLIRFVIGLTQLARIRRHGQAVTTTGGPVIWESTQVATPVTIGLVAPRVIVPAAWREWTPGMLTAVLAHERAHCARRDPLIALLARLNATLFWFHPLSWWLERQLGTLAELACDEAALTQVTPRQYAETLLAIATTARRHKGRLVWQGVGVDGDGRLGQRIDLVLSGQSRAKVSRARQAIVAASCAAATVVAVACQQEVKVEPLREDPELAATLKAQREREQSFAADRRMSPEEVAALERDLQLNPEDTATRSRLLTYYAATIRTRPDESLAARRRHAVWIVENHPEGDLARHMSVSKDTDPEGYATLRSLWLEHVGRKDANPSVLTNAALFFERSDKPLAEQLLVRGKALQPDGPLPRIRGTDNFRIYVPTWSEQLGRLYGETMTGDSDRGSKTWARERLQKSNDGEVLSTGGFLLVNRSADQEQQAFGRRLLEQASLLDSPAAAVARTRLQQLDRRNAPEGQIIATPQESRQAILEKATGVNKIRQLAALAESDYLISEYYDWRSRQAPGTEFASPNADADKRKAAEGFAHSKAYAREAIDLSPSVTGPGVGEAAFSARLSYGLILLREGDRKGAVQQMLAAATLPPPDQPGAGGWAASAQEYRLVFYLLKEGERQTIIDYFERAAQGRDEARRKVMLASAAAIRDGRMPEHYQQLLALGSL